VTSVPAVTVAGPFLVTATSAEVLTVVSNVAVLLPPLGSVVVELTVALSCSTLPLPVLGLIMATTVTVVLAPAARVPRLPEL